MATQDQLAFEPQLRSNRRCGTAVVALQCASRHQYRTTRLPRFSRQKLEFSDFITGEQRTRQVISFAPDTTPLPPALGCTGEELKR